MNEFHKDLKDTFGGSVFRAIAEVGPFDSMVRLHILNEQENGDIEGLLFFDEGCSTQVTISSYTKRSDTEWVVKGGGKTFYWRTVNPDAAQHFSDYLDS